MLKIEHTDVYGFNTAIRGMRNPKNSWDKSDSYWTYIEDPQTHNTAKFQFFVGEADKELMMKLAKGGPVHAKYRRMIIVTLDITAPLYWWKEFDTYKVGTVANSCSTMHKIHDKEFTLDDFSHEHLNEWGMSLLGHIISFINENREKFNESKTKNDWWQMIQLLPSPYNQKRTIMLNYEVLCSMYHDRKNHKLDEWHVFCDWIRKLPHSDLITGEEND